MSNKDLESEFRNNCRFLNKHFTGVVLVEKTKEIIYRFAFEVNTESFLSILEDDDLNFYDCSKVIVIDHNMGSSVIFYMNNFKELDIELLQKYFISTLNTGRQNKII